MNPILAKGGAEIPYPISFLNNKSSMNFENLSFQKSDFILNRNT